MEPKPPAKRKRLGEILIEEGVINDLQLSSALGEQKRWGGRLGSILLKMGYLTEEDLALALQQRLGIKWLSLRDLKIPDVVLKRLPAEMAKQFTVFPVAIDGKSLVVATADPTDLMTIDTLSFNAGMNVKTVLAMESDIKWAIAKYYDKTIPDEPAPQQRTEPVQPKTDEKKQVSVIQTRITTETALEALVGLLIEKGVITRDELAKRISESKKL